MKPFEIDIDARYAVRLARVVQRGRTKLLPRDRHEMTGAVLADIVGTHGWEAVHGADNADR